MNHSLDQKTEELLGESESESWLNLVPLRIHWDRTEPRFKFIYRVVLKGERYTVSEKKKEIGWEERKVLHAPSLGKLCNSWKN